MRYKRGRKEGVCDLGRSLLSHVNVDGIVEVARLRLG